MRGASDVTGQGEVVELRGGRAGLAVRRGEGQESGAAQRELNRHTVPWKDK